MASTPPWITKNQGILPRNATNAHTVPFGFTPAAGSELVLMINGGVTHAITGWEKRLSPVTSGELAIFTKTSAGETSAAVTHNGADYPITWACFELPAGATWTTGTSANASDDNTLAIAGLPGTEQVVWTVRGCSSTGLAVTGASIAYPGPWVESVDEFTPEEAGGINSSHLSVAHQIITATSLAATAPVVTYVNSQTVGDRQHAIFAMAIPNVTPPSGSVWNTAYAVKIG